MTEAKVERVFSGSGADSSKKRKSLSAENLARATKCRENEKNFPVGFMELKAAHKQA